jgi:hypothetical protein
MKQFVGNQYCMSREMKAFRVEDADRLFFACRFEGSNEGFVIEKDAFCRQMNRGRILPSVDAGSVAI